MKRVAYADLLDRLRRQDRAAAAGGTLLDGAALPRRKEASKNLKVRITPEQKTFVVDAAAATRSTAIDEATIVAAGLAILQDLDIPWASLSSREELVDAIKRQLKEKR